MKIRVNLHKKLVNESPYDGVKEEVLRKTSALGIRPFERPKLEEDEYTTTFPSDLSVVHDQELGKLHSIYTGLACYVESQAALADADLMIAEGNLDHIKSKCLLLKEDDKEKVHDSKARAATNTEVMEATRKFYVAKATYEFISNKFESYVRCCQTVSREISRRANEYPNIARNEKI